MEEAAAAAAAAQSRRHRSGRKLSEHIPNQFVILFTCGFYKLDCRVNSAEVQTEFHISRLV